MLNLGTNLDTGKPFELDPQNLKKHFVALGASGSGKTVLCKAIIEEAALKGIPAIIIDPQGDLSSLALTNKKISSPVKIFTPSSSKGIQISVNPLTLPHDIDDEEDLISIIQQIANSITSILGFSLQRDDGKAAQGFIYKILMYCYDENITLKDFNNLARFISSMPQPLEEDTRAIVSQKEKTLIIKKIKLLTIGEKELMFNRGIPLDIRSMIAKDSISIIYLNSLESQLDKEFFISMLTTKLYEYMLKNPKKELQLLYYIDEVSSYLPAGTRLTLCKPILTLLYKQARKYGIGCMLSTQNPGDIDYKSFAQFSTWAIGRLTLKQDLDKVKTALSSQTDAEEITRQLPSLKPSEFIIFSPDSLKKPTKIKCRWLLTEHKTLTENDIKKIMRTGINPKSDSPKKTKRSSAIRELHFPINISDIKNIAKSHIKKTLLIFGKDKETIESIELKFIPFYNTRLKTEERRIFRKEIKEYNVIFSALDGNPCIITKTQFINYDDFSSLISLKEDEIKVLKAMQQRARIKPEEICRITGETLEKVSHTLRSLQKKEIASYDKSGEIYFWFAKKQISMPDEISTMHTDYLELTAEETDASLVKPKMMMNDIKHIIKAWFKAEVVSSDIAYYPIYEVKYKGDKGSRILCFSAVSGKTIAL